MKLDSKAIKEIAKRVNKLNTLEKELSNFDGYFISITKLTILKFLCRDASSMCQFAYYLSLKIEPRIQIEDSQENLRSNIFTSQRIMKNILENAKHQDTFKIDNNHIDSLKANLTTLSEFQNEIKKQKWSDVRLINNGDVFLLELVIECFIYSDDPNTGYKLAKSYTERYNSSYGTGLIPDSLESLKEVNRFWNSYLYNMLKNEGNIK